MPKGVLPSLQLQAASGISRKKLHQWLRDAAQECNRARNAMLRYWVSSREQDADWQPKIKTKKDGSVKMWKNRPVYDPFKPKEQTALYHVGTSRVPRLNAKLISSCTGEVLDRLKANMPYNHEGPGRWKWEALLNYEINQDSWRSPCIPVPNQDSTLYWDGEHKPLSSGVDARIRRYGGNGVVLRLPLWSRTCGHTRKDVIVRLGVEKIRPGHKRILRQIAAGQLKMSDSHLVEKDGKWFFRLCYEVPTKDHGLNLDNVLTIRMARDRGMQLVLPDGRTWRLGDDQPLKHEHERLAIRRKAVRERSTYGHGKGHGKKRFYDKLRPFSRRFLDMQSEYVNHCLSDVVRTCIKMDCGTVLYREPTKPLRDKSWYAHHGIPFNWSTFQPKLQFALEKNTIELTVKRMPMKEWLEIFGDTKAQSHG